MKENEINMNNIMLDKSQYRIFAGLAIQRDELQKMFQELIEAERQHIAMLVRQYGLDDGDYVIQQENDNIYLVRKDSKSS